MTVNIIAEGGTQGCEPEAAAEQRRTRLVSSRSVSIGSSTLLVFGANCSAVRLQSR